ncbi:MAG: hypothetical protein H6607_04420 [Flavobacteriales bacterium]|nr:hypothetical protein [Flavobacteriales bacterium]
MNPEEIYNRTDTLVQACLKVAMVLPAESTMATFARVELVRYASELGIKSRGLMVGQLSEIFVERLSKAADAANGCAFWLEYILTNNIFPKPDIIIPLKEESDAMAKLFLASLKNAKNKLD